MTKQYDLRVVECDGATNYILYKKHWFFFNLFYDWHLVVDTDSFDALKYYIENGTEY
jgi:hypothetical protein